MQSSYAMYNLLILGMGGEVSKGILKAVRASEVPCHVIGACIGEESDGLYFCDEAFVCPYAASSEFIPWLIRICREKNIDMVLTGVEENVLAISEAMPRLTAELKTIFRVCSLEQLKIGGDKLETCRWLQENNFPFPAYADAGDEQAVRNLVAAVGFPLVAKPRGGKSSIGVRILQNAQALQQYGDFQDYVLEECVGTADQEYTVGCYYGLHGEVPEPIIMRRSLKNGSSKTVEVVKNEKIRELAEGICKKFKPNGPLNIQLRLRPDGTPVPFEFNVRFSGTTPMRSHFGFRDVKAMLTESLLQQGIGSCFRIQPGIAFRYTEEHYLRSRELHEDGSVTWEEF